MADFFRAFILFGVVLILLYGLIPNPSQESSPQLPTLASVENLAFVASPISYIVKVSVYEPVTAQCDSFPNETADGTRFSVKKAGSYRYCALSRDLLQRWGGPFAFGDTIHLKDVKHLSGKWIVRDTMNSKWKNRVDLLVDVGTYPHTFDEVEMRFAHGLENSRGRAN